MLTFHSASVRIANTDRAVDECLDVAFGAAPPADCRALMVNAAIGHKLDKIAAAFHRELPGATVFASSCGGVVGREGAGESLSHMAVMAVCGPAEEIACAAVDGIHGDNSYEKGLELARGLRAKLPAASVVYLLCPGLDIACDLVIRAFVEVFGEAVTVFGGTAADNYKAIATYQYIGDAATSHGAWAVGMADPTLRAVTRASHGFTAYGDPMVVTKAEGNRVYEIDGMPAWAAYMSRLKLIPEDDNRQTLIAAGALALELPAELAEEYGNAHILRGAARQEGQSVMFLSVTCEEGTRLWLTTRDEELIFSEQKKAMDYLAQCLEGRRPAAVFQADCLARGRTLFNRVMKDELIGMIQSALSGDGETPPWLGMYGFGEFAKLGGQNTFHTYTTSLLVLYRD